MVAHADIPLSLILFENSRMNLPSLGSHMGLPLPKPPQNRYRTNLPSPLGKVAALAVGGVLYRLNFFYSFTFVLMPHGHFLSVASERKQRDALRSGKTLSVVALR